jgi:hypothetical protein
VSMSGDGGFRMLSSGFGLYRSSRSACSAPSLPLGVSDYARGVTDLLVVEHGQDEKAEQALSRLQTSSANVDIPTPRESVALLSQTNAIEKRITEGAGYSECFKGTNLRRTEITVGTWVTQQMCGPVLQVS